MIITRDFGNFSYSSRVAYTDAIDTIQNNIDDVASLVEAICRMCPDAIIINQVYPSNQYYFFIFFVNNFAITQIT